MATTPGSSVWVEDQVIKQTWSAIPNGNDGAPLATGRMADKCVQILGTFGAGGSVLIEGSNDGGTTWFTLNGVTKVGGLIYTAAGGEQIIENPLLIRPRVTAGDGTTALTVIIAARGFL